MDSDYQTIPDNQTLILPDYQGMHQWLAQCVQFSKHDLINGQFVQGLDVHWA